MTLDKACKRILIETPFFGLFLLQLQREFSDKIPTAAVALNGIGVKLLVNKNFWESLSDKEQIAILIHELSHVCFNHLIIQDNFPHKQIFNIAADMEINSYIENLPKGCVYSSLIGAEPKKGTKYYYEELCKPENSKIVMQYSPIDSHDFWEALGKLPEAEKELIKNQIEHQIKNSAEQVKKMNGTIPRHLEEYINSLFQIKEKIFDWKSYFRNILTGVYDINLKKTHRRESHRFEGGAAIKHKKRTKILVGIDTSGSVSNEELCDFFSEIHHIYKAGAKVRILECDTQINRNYEYDGKWDLKCSGRGGTILKPCSDYYLAHKGEYNKLILFTDGYFNLSEIQTPINDTIFIITSGGAKQDYPGKIIYIPTK